MVEPTEEEPTAAILLHRACSTAALLAPQAGIRRVRRLLRVVQHAHHVYTVDPGGVNVPPVPPATPVPPVTAGGARVLDETDLKIDEQAHKLIELKQKFTYFLVTAAIAVIVFASKFLLDYGKVHPEALALTGAVICLLGAAFAGLISSSTALFSVYQGHRAYEVHLSARSRRATELTATQAKAMDGATESQSNLLVCSMIFLAIEILLSIVFFTWVLS